MGLMNRYKKVKAAEKRKKNSSEPEISVDELDDFDIDAGDQLEAEIAAELEAEKREKAKRRARLK